jgi:DMSO/TMAO reductase YedYZ molybdopterin-dependent catalytic subunit
MSWRLVADYAGAGGWQDGSAGDGRDWAGAQKGLTAGMRQPHLSAGMPGNPAPLPTEGGPLGAASGRVPPGQYIQAALPVLHYGPVPGCDRRTWDLRVYGATASSAEHRWTWDHFTALPHAEIVADFHCVTKFTVLGISWSGVAAADVLRAAPPDDSARHVMVWADYGYSANLPLDVFGAPDTMLATHREGSGLRPEQGALVRLVVPSRYGWKSVKWVRAIEYLIEDRRGFWEERGYHNGADPWREQRYSYQESPGDGPEQ